MSINSHDIRSAFAVTCRQYWWLRAVTLLGIVAFVGIFAYSALFTSDPSPDADFDTVVGTAVKETVINTALRVVSVMAMIVLLVTIFIKSHTSQVPRIPLLAIATAALLAVFVLTMIVSMALEVSELRRLTAEPLSEPAGDGLDFVAVMVATTFVVALTLFAILATLLRRNADTDLLRAATMMQWAVTAAGVTVLIVLIIAGIVLNSTDAGINGMIALGAVGLLLSIVAYVLAVTGLLKCFKAQD